MGFDGASYPTALHIDFLCEDNTEDYKLKKAADLIIGNIRGSMKDISLNDLINLVSESQIVENHPIRRFLLDGDVVDAVQGDAQARLRVFRQSGRSMSQDELKSAKQKAEGIGNAGEELIAMYFESLIETGNIAGYEWVSRHNAIAPYDFKLTTPAGDSQILDVKSTQSTFTTQLHISMAEIIVMANSPERYDLYRVYDLTEKGGKLRISTNLKPFAQSLVDTLQQLPAGIRIDSISVDPNQLSFGQEVDILFPEEEY